MCNEWLITLPVPFFHFPLSSVRELMTGVYEIQYLGHFVKLCRSMESVILWYECAFKCRTLPYFNL